MSCPQCGRAFADGDRFCGGCGVELTARCTRCAHQLAPDTAYCTSCGHARASPATATAPTEDRRRVSVLFIDLIDFTPYAEREDPERVRRMQTHFYAVARRVVQQYGGVVEKYIGDAVMALFGAPVATEADALRCVRAGLELQRVLATFSTTTDEPARGMRFRVGVATGEALVDVAAARDGGQAIVAGDVVNTASRLQTVAPPGGVLVCGQTRGLTVDAVSYADQPPVTLRGRSSPTEVWLAIGLAPRQVTTPDVLPLIEREHELSLLINALHRAVQDRTPQLVTIFGQAGIGKSRLVRELRRHADRTFEAPLTWHTGQCPPFGENVTYAGLAEIIKAAAGVLDTDSAETMRFRLLQAARAMLPDPEADRIAASLGPLVGLPGENLQVNEAETGWRRFLIAMAARRPTVLIFEDLHWADESMLRFIELLAAGARDVPLLLLTTARPELVDRDPSWAGTIAGSLTVTLSSLRTTGIATLYAQLLGQATFTPDLLAPLVERAAGNPLYAQEYVRMLVQRGALPAEPERRLDLPDLPTPDSVQAVIANRVDLLDPADRAALQTAAVVGLHFWPAAVAAALGRPAERVERSLRRLEQREFIVEQPESTVAGQSEFRFEHVLVRDVCYQRLPRTERVARHERVAAWLETLSDWDSDTATQLAEVLAHHRWTAHEIARTISITAEPYASAAREALYKAARRAYNLQALETAAGHIERALSLFASSPERPDDRDRLRTELLAAEIGLYRDQSGFLADAGRDRLQQLADALTAAGAEADAARAWTLLGQVAWVNADRPAALKCLGRAAALFTQLPDSSDKVDAYSEIGRLHMLNHEREPALAAARTAAEIAQRLGLVEAHAHARITIATTSFHAGDPDALAELMAITDHCRSGQLLALRRATQNLANALLEEGEWARSVELVNAGQPAVQGGHNLATGYSPDALRAYATGDLNAFAAAADAPADTPGGRWDLRIRGLRALLRVLRDEPSVAAEEIDEVLAHARSSEFHRPLWTALAIAGLCRALQQRQAEASGLLTELVLSWQKVGVMASGAWVCPAGHASAIAGPEPADALRTGLINSTRRTKWAEAALHTVNGAVRLASGAAGEAGQEHLLAAATYADIPAVPDRMLSLALAADAFRRAGEHREAELAQAEVDAFALRTGTPGLRRVGHSTS